MRVKQPLRFTGENPPVGILAEYPNWTVAYDEEDIEGQDETTLKPQDDQSQITDETYWSAGDIVLADGESMAVFIYVVSGEIAGFCVYHDPEWPYVSFSEKSGVWVVQPDYLSDDRDRPERWWKRQRFPVRVSSRLPLYSTGKPWQIALDEDGKPSDAVD